MSILCLHIKCQNNKECFAYVKVFFNYITLIFKMESANNLCRICINSITSFDLTNIFTSYEKFNMISTAIMECAPVHINLDDNLPQYICNMCIDDLSKAHQFRAKCIQSDIYLRKRNSDFSSSTKIEDIILKEELEHELNICDQIKDNSTEFKLKEENENSERSYRDDVENDEDSDENISLLEIKKRQTDLSILKKKRCKRKISNSHSQSTTRNHKVDRDKLNTEVNYCDSCKMTFSNRPNLLRHLRTHKGDKNYSCKVCGKRFATPAYVKSHSIVHTRERRFACDTCGKTFTFNSDLTVHMRKHSGERPYVCEVCAKSFVSSSALTAHRFKHGPKRFFCVVCNRGFTYKQEADSHSFAHRNDRFIIIDDPDHQTKITPSVVELYGAVVEHKNDENSEKVADTKNDSIKFEDNHMNTIENTDNKINSTSIIYSRTEKEPYKITKENYDQYVETYKRLKNSVKSENFTCDVCNRILSSLSNLYRHKLIHTGLKPYVCEICNKSFKLRADLQEHKNRHLGIRKIQCEFCPKMFPTKSDYGKHVSIHMDHKPFVCDICSKSYYNIYALKQHRKDHLHEFKCSYTGCTKSYPTQEKLDKHSKLHDETKRRFRCDFCTNSLGTVKSLIRHVRKVHKQDVQQSVVNKS